MITISPIVEDRITERERERDNESNGVESIEQMIKLEKGALDPDIMDAIAPPKEENRNGGTWFPTANTEQTLRRLCVRGNTERIEEANWTSQWDSRAQMRATV